MIATRVFGALALASPATRFHARRAEAPLSHRARRVTMSACRHVMEACGRFGG
jgi:hypothetical protein